MRDDAIVPAERGASERLAFSRCVKERPRARRRLCCGKRGSRRVGAGAESFTDPLKRANETDLGMGRYEVTDIIGECAERDGESDIDSSVYVWYARQE